MKKLFIILPLVLVLCFAYGCQDKAAMAELEEFRAQAKIEEQNIAIVKHFFDELNKGNVEVWKEVCAPDFAFYSQSQVTEPSSLEEIVDGFNSAFKAFPDFNWVINDLIAAGDKIIARSSITGTLSGEGLGIPAIGNEIKTGAIEIWNMKDGKCVEVRAMYDERRMMEQLGMELKPKEGE
jgi:steroid delta-isomerase-like uncharacterized protein